MSFLRNFKVVLSVLMVVMSFPSVVLANQTFHKGQTVLVGFPAANIKEDAYIIGLVERTLKNGDYQISVLDYVKGHDYGVSCVPIREDALGKPKVVWEQWQDTKQLYGKGMQYQVKGKDVWALKKGQFYFIERNNLNINFDRWKSNVPILAIENFDRAISSAKSLGLKGMVPAFELAKQDREAYYDVATGRPLLPQETIKPLNQLVGKIIEIFKQHPELKAKWADKTHRWQKKDSTTYDYFMVDAIDTILTHAASLLYEEGIEQAPKKSVTHLKAQLKTLGIKVH